MGRKNRFKIWRAFLLGIAVLVGSQTALLAEKLPPAREIISRMVTRMSEVNKDEATTLDGFQGIFSFNIKLAPSVYQTVKIPLSSILNREVGPELSGAGTFKVKFDDTSQDWRDGRFFLEVSSNQFSFLFLRNKNEFTFFSPQLNLKVVKDDLARITEMVGKNYSNVPQIPYFPPPTPPDRKLSTLLRMLVDKIYTDSDRITRAAKVTKFTAGGGADCYRLTFPGEKKETIQLDVRPDNFTPVSLKVLSAKEDFTIQAEFPKPKTEKVSLFNYLPVKILLTGKHQGNTASLEVKEIRYNSFLSEDDFCLKEINLTEFLGFICLKAFVGK